jgi:YHS domain-containing protein
MIVRLSPLAALFAAMLFGLSATTAIAQEGPVFRDIDDIAILGYDPVAYFTLSEPTQGTQDRLHEWLSAKWLFANGGHRDLFMSSPEKYAPQFGGNCTIGLANGFRESVDPTAWTIIDGQLYLFQNREKLDEFNKNPDLYLAQAEASWRRLRNLQ